MNGNVIEVPARIALGRWENETTFWRLLVEQRRLHHLGNRMEPPPWRVRDRLALGDEVFQGVIDLPREEIQYEVLRRTEAFLHSPLLRRIYLDVTNIRLASRTLTATQARVTLLGRNSSSSWSIRSCSARPVSSRMERLCGETVSAASSC